MKKILLSILMVVATVSYAQFYEPEHLWHRCGYQAGDWFGKYIAGIGDVNGDSCEDFLAYDKLGNFPYVRLFYGGNPPDTVADLIFHNPYSYGGFGFDIENVGDVNGDGWEDFTIRGGYTEDNVYRVFVFFGGVMLDTLPDVVLSEGILDDCFGSNIEGIGDVNADGYDDIAVHSSNYDHGRGKVWIYFGGNPMDNIADWEQAGSNQQVFFGQSIAGNGDINDDGYDDFAIFEWTGAPDPFSTSYYVYFGGSEISTIPSVIIDGQEYYPDVDLGNSSALISNLNGDQYSDLVIISGYTSNAIVLYGGNPMDTEIDVVLQGFDPSPLDWTMNVSATGDVNRDGYGDVIVSQLGAYGQGSLTLLFLGGPWMNGHPDMYWLGLMTPWEGCGRSLCDCGDINGDGVDDIMFGSYQGDFNNRGCVDIWAGDTAFVTHAPIETPQPVPNVFRLLSPYPNPFNNAVTIPFEVYSPLAGDVSLIIYNVLGQMVVDLRGEVREAISQHNSGSFQVLWDGEDTFGHDVSSGVYIIILQWGVNRQLRKAVLLR